MNLTLTPCEVAALENRRETWAFLALWHRQKATSCEDNADRAAACAHRDRAEDLEWRRPS